MRTKEFLGFFQEGRVNQVCLLINDSFIYVISYMCLKNDTEYILVEWLFEVWGFYFFFPSLMGAVYSVSTNPLLNRLCARHHGE